MFLELLVVETSTFKEHPCKHLNPSQSKTSLSSHFQVFVLFGRNSCVTPDLASFIRESEVPRKGTGGYGSLFHVLVSLLVSAFLTEHKIQMSVVVSGFFVQCQSSIMDLQTHLHLVHTGRPSFIVIVFIHGCILPFCTLCIAQILCRRMFSSVVLMVRWKKVNDHYNWGMHMCWINQQSCPLLISQCQAC